MIEVISKRPKKEVTCSCCWNILTYEKEDIKFCSNISNEHVMAYGYIVCPVCKKRIKVFDKELIK